MVRGHDDDLGIDSAWMGRMVVSDWVGDSCTALLLEVEVVDSDSIGSVGLELGKRVPGVTEGLRRRRLRRKRRRRGELVGSSWVRRG